ncbi:hypothetical protein HOLleu_29075 [Holothuria leucospilota]|uniref:Uncharacterized protein n=1 Tax=Holothuria leucospilota TaxID=206669 RepID=A0A9Q1BN95_HOLLE|nr:hypothetical protein HOLleu_29075 [Holothuria leucospilota]
MEDKTYRPLNRDPTTSLENKIGKAIKELKEQNKLNKKQVTQLTSRTSLSPRSYGLPKVHKEGIPLRPIVSSINSPSYNLARHLADILTPKAYQARGCHTLKTPNTLLKGLRRYQ